ncbi:hypothetical protein IH980_02085 [Patescibacteria group bacterium]|nr:hypothetical protein [Patescibacteria group bacterium]
MDIKETRKRLIAAYKLLSEETTTRHKFESIRSLIQGVNPQIDRALESCSKALKELEKVRKRKLIDLTAKRLPEKTEKQKKRKKVLLLFLKRWKKLKRTVKRVSGEYQKGREGEVEAPTEQVTGLGKSLALAKGPLVVLTTIAVAAVGGFMYLRSSRTPTVAEPVQQSPTVVTEKKIVEESGVEDDSVLSYWVKEGAVDVDAAGAQTIWGIHIHKEDTGIRQRGEDVPAMGAVVTAELRSQSGTTPLSGTVGADGWVRWTEPLPTQETGLYIIEVKGELPWSSTNQLAWENRPLASSRPGP